MASLNQSEQHEDYENFVDIPNDLSFLPEIQNGSFLNDDNLNYKKENISPSYSVEAPGLLLPALTDAVEDKYSEFFCIINPVTGRLEEAGPSNMNRYNEENPTFEVNQDIVPVKRTKKELTLYEETLLKKFSAEIEKEQKLLAEEHEMKMKLWDLEMQTSQQQHALKMAILKTELEKVQQEKQNLQLERNSKYLNRFASGPI